MTSVYASYTARNRWVFNSLLNVTRQQVFLISAGREFTLKPLNVHEMKMILHFWRSNGK